MKTYDVDVTRTAYGHKTIRVLAVSETAARLKVMNEAGDHEFQTKSADYEINSVALVNLTATKIKATPFSNSLSSVRKQVMGAYGDCHDEGDPTQRNLSFRASAAVSRDEAIAILGEAISQGYNEFEASLLGQLPADSRITIAREGSVCIYVVGNLTGVPGLQNNIKADELDYESTQNETRLWWD